MEEWLIDIDPVLMKREHSAFSSPFEWHGQREGPALLLFLLDNGMSDKQEKETGKTVTNFSWTIHNFL